MSKPNQTTREPSLVTDLGGTTYYGRFLYRKGDLIVAEWCADRAFKGPIHQEGIKAHLVSRLDGATRG